MSGVEGRRTHRPALAALVAVFLGAACLTGPARAAESFVLTPDLQYSYPSSDPPRHRLDVYQPLAPGRGLSPVVVWIHGGGWYQGSKESAVLDKARRFTRAGYLFVSVNYRLSPRVTDPDSLLPGRTMFPAQPRDAAEAVAWVGRNIVRFGGDPDRIVLMGHSAGAQIAALLATDHRFLGSAGVGKSQILGVISLDAVGLDVDALTDPASPYRGEEQKPAYWNVFGTPDENEVLDRWRRASPLAFAGPNDPPFLFVVPDDVPLRNREVRLMCRRIGLDPLRSVVRVEKTHRQVNRHFGRPGGRRETRLAMRFLRRVAGFEVPSG